jgi:hypothetical protein
MGCSLVMHESPVACVGQPCTNGRRIDVRCTQLNAHAANKGIGKEIAVALAAQGVKVVATARNGALRLGWIGIHEFTGVGKHPPSGRKHAQRNCQPSCTHALRVIGSSCSSRHREGGWCAT